MNKSFHHRRSIRLKDYDYSQAGTYFVTVCAEQRQCVFGEIVNDVMQLNEYGCAAAASWAEIPEHFPYVELDAFVVMPNHVHGIIVICKAVGAQHAAPLHPNPNQHPNVAPQSLGAIVRAFKSAVTKRINALRGASGAGVWQRNFYEHIIRDERDLNAIREYITNTPLQWALDKENPQR